MTRFIPFLILIAFVGLSCQKGKTQLKNTEMSNWRGPNRDGIYPEKNLLKQWSENGPEMLWSFEGLGHGHSSVAVISDRVFVTGVKDTIVSEGTLFTFDLNGNLLWQKNYGKDFCLNFHGTRSVPVVVDDLIYTESGMGAVYCLKTETGEQV